MKKANEISANLMPMVSICMITYNHGKYIEEAINGVLMQQYEGEIELVIANDGSPDDTDIIIKKIIKEHINGHWIKYTKHATNLGMMPNFIWTLQQCKGEYIALCEGDDYWTNPLKLQMQVAFLEANLDYSICWSKYKVLDKNNNIKPQDGIDLVNFKNDRYDISLDSFYDTYMVLTLTCIFRKTAFDSNILNKLEFGKDNTLYVLCLLSGKGMMLNFFSAVYRIHEGGIFSSASQLNKLKSNYENLKEINQILLKNKIPKLKTLEFTFLQKMYYTQCSLKGTNDWNFKLLFKTYLVILSSSTWRDKLIASKDLLKQVYLK